jgi:hypothetical protein
MSRLVVALLLSWIVLSQSGCATGWFGDAPHPSREKALSDCLKEVPPEAVPYADAFSACMEERGWVYTGTAGPRK